MPRSVLILQHVPLERPAILGDILTSRNVPWTTRSFLYGPPPSDVSDVSALVVLGGPMGALDFDKHPGLRTEAALVRSVIDRGLPVLGICLGHQIVSTVLGAALHSGAANEVGVGTVDVVTDDPVFGAAGSTSPVLHWHYDVVDVPDGATVLASTDQTPNQAMRVGDTIFSTQFHIEVDRPMLDRWLAVDEMADELAPEARLSIHSDFDAVEPQMRAAADRVFSEFAAAVLFRN
jgi:GMP synthase (glutamine-hydrolysing)